MTDTMRVLHVIGAVLLIGDLVYSGFWFGRAMKRGDASLRSYVLATMAWSSKTYALPAILLNLITGLALLHFAKVAMASAVWLWIALILYVVVTGLWHGVLIPKRKKMAALIGEPEKGGKAGAAAGAAAAGDFDSMARGWLQINGVTVLLLFAILVLMVWRPML
ncbi:MAG TPA: DUF2269 family protein [Candidatus Eisenbacteria bacterium]|nr:DUF2269 family protein [Candidatus Eisenbacteria bacterium]